MTEMDQNGLIAERSGDTIIARFPREGEPLFPDKATATLYLGAD